jgi:hypothetical protein
MLALLSGRDRPYEKILTSRIAFGVIPKCTRHTIQNDGGEVALIGDRLTLRNQLVRSFARGKRDFDLANEPVSRLFVSGEGSRLCDRGSALLCGFLLRENR